MILLNLCGLVASQATAKEKVDRYQDSLNLQMLSDKAWSLKDSDPDSSFQLAMQALKLSRENGFKKIEAYSLADIGNYYKRKEAYQEAEKYLLASLSVRRAMSDTTDIASGYNLLGILYYQQEKYDSSVSYYRKGLKWLPQKTKYDRLRIKIYDGLAMSLMREGNFQQAQDYIGQSIDKASELEDSIILAKSWQNQGVLYEYIGRSERALEYYSKAELFYRSKGNLNGTIDILINKGVVCLHRRDFTQAIVLLQEAKEISVKRGFRENLSSIYNNLALAYQGAEQMELAREQFMLGVRLADSLNKPQRKIETGLNLIRLEQAEKNNEKVLVLIRQYEAFIQNEGNAQHLSTLYKYYAFALGQMGKYEEAYKVEVKAARIKDSLNRVIDNAQLQAVEIERIGREKELLRQESEIKQIRLSEQIYRQRLYITFFSLLAAIFLLSTLFFYSKRRNAKQRLKLVEAERKMLIARDQTEKKVREEIGDELHDNMTKQLSLARMKMDGIVAKLPELSTELREEYERIRGLLDTYYKNVRRLSHKLLKEKPLGSHLVQRIQEYLADIRSSGNLQVHFSSDSIPEVLPEGLVDETLAIINVAIHNVILHAQATELSIQVYREKAFLHLTIEDNGKGFEMNTQQSNGTGIQNLKKRVERLEAECHIDSSAGKGTLIVIKIPLNFKE